MHRPGLLILCAWCVWGVLSLAGGPASAASTVVVRAGSASISNDPDAGTWTISSSGASLTLALGAARDFATLKLAWPGAASWIAAEGADALVKIGGRTLPIGNRAAGFTYQGVTTSVSGSTVQLDATFDLPSARLRAIRHYAATSGSPTFETWTTFASLGGAITVSDLSAFRFTVPAGTVRWLNGLQGDAPNEPTDTAFARQQRDLAVGARLTLGAAGRSSEQVVPWFAIDGGSEEFFAGLMWSGAWSLTIDRTATGLDLALGLAPMSTTTSGRVDGPRAFFGVARGGLRGASVALRTFILEGVRRGRPLTPLVTYNTWFAYGVDIDETSMSIEIDGAASLGAELFVVDAGWWIGAGRGGVSDFSSGLGNWSVDASRFPNGLEALTDYAHERGMKLGIWVEPERVAQNTLNQRGLAQESWTAKAGGKYGSSQSAQLCLASAAARQWLLNQLVGLIEAVHPDYLKWDNNFWINCDRDGHGHGSSDGNFAHVNGLYDLLGALRERYPGLLIENVSGGGNRMDVGMMRYSDVAWMDDRSAPSAHVRHIAQGLSVVFPPAYLLSFVMEHVGESLHRASDMPLFFRSRMMGALGLCFRTGEFEEGERADMAHEVDIYKLLRSTLSTAAAALLTPQAEVRDGPAWDVLQATAPGKPMLLAGVQSDAAVEEFTVKPLGLFPRTTYEVRSVDLGVIGDALGSQIMREGLTLIASPTSAAHILILTALQ